MLRVSYRTTPTKFQDYHYYYWGAGQMQFVRFSIIDVNDNEFDSYPKVKCIHEEQIS